MPLTLGCFNNSRAKISISRVKYLSCISAQIVQWQNAFLVRKRSRVRFSLWAHLKNKFVIKIYQDLTFLDTIHLHARLPKWPTGADCKSAGVRLRRFESFTWHRTLHYWFMQCTVRHIAIIKTKCRDSSAVEHLFCKQGVQGSNPCLGS